MRGRRTLIWCCGRSHRTCEGEVSSRNSIRVQVRYQLILPPTSRLFQVQEPKSGLSICGSERKLEVVGKVMDIATKTKTQVRCRLDYLSSLCALIGRISPHSTSFLQRQLLRDSYRRLLSLMKQTYPQSLDRSIYFNNFTIGTVPASCENNQD